MAISFEVVRRAWSRQPLAYARAQSGFRWDVLVNQAAPMVNAATRQRVTPRGAALSSNGFVGRNWYGVNALEQIAAPLPTTATGYSLLWVGPMNVSNTGTPVSVIRTTGGGVRFEPYTTPGGAYVTATHTGVASLNVPGPWSWGFDARPWVVLVSYDGTTATVEVRTPNGEYGVATTTASMSSGTGTIDLSTSSGSFGAYVVGYACRPMPRGLRQRLLSNPWLAFDAADDPLFVDVGGGAATLVVADALQGHLADSMTLTQAHVLALADATQAHVADAVTLTQAHALAVSEAVHAHLADGVTLTQAHALAVADAVHAHAAEQPTLSTAGDLVLADALHAHAADGVTLSQVHALAVSDALHGHAADGIALTGLGDLQLSDAVHAHLADALSLSQAHYLVVSDAVHQHLADALSLGIPGAGAVSSDRVLVVRAAGRTLVVLRASRVLSVAPAGRSLSVH